MGGRLANSRLRGGCHSWFGCSSVDRTQLKPNTGTAIKMRVSGTRTIQIVRSDRSHSVP